MEMRRVVVTGLGALTPIGKNIPDYLEGLRKGVSGSDWITRFDAEKFKTRFACEIKGFDPKDHFDRKEARKMDLFTQFAFVAAQEAIEDSGMDLEQLDRDRAGIIWASGIGGITTFLEEIKGFVNGAETPRFSPFFIPKMISDIAAGLLAIKYGFMGPNFATVSACASSTHSLIDAFNYIRWGKADVFITGGSEASINEPGLGGFISMQAVSTNNDEYKTASRPFDNTRDGFVMGEGAGALILEEYEHAKARGATIYAEVLGAGMSADAFHMTATHPDGLGAMKSMNNALEDSNLRPEDLDYINVHGTATPVGDPPEIKAIQSVFGDHAYNLNVSATKSMTGHLLGAAGAIETIAGILAMKHGFVPPTINHKEWDPRIDERMNLTLNKPQEREVRRFLSNTFGFGGHNASVILGNLTD